MNAPPLRPDPVPSASSPGREMIRSQEHLTVSTVRVPARRVRLEKFVVTETRTVTVEVSHEQVRLVDVDLAIDPQGPPVAFDGSDPTASGTDPARWLTLSDERIVVTLEVVPVERVRLDVAPVVELREVTAAVRREELLVESATTPATTPATTSAPASDTPAAPAPGETALNLDRAVDPWGVRGSDPARHDASSI